MSNAPTTTGWSKHFDLDLAFGKDGERWLELLADERKIEVKRERDSWVKTGNIFIETRSRGQASGVSTTQSEFWAHILSLNGKAQGVILVRVELLRFNLRRLFSLGKIKIVEGGDAGSSRGLLIPLNLVHELIKPEGEQ